MVPLFLPFGSVSTTPTHLPAANVVTPMYATSPRIFLPATSTFWPTRNFGSDIVQYVKTISTEKYNKNHEKKLLTLTFAVIDQYCILVWVTAIESLVER